MKQIYIFFIFIFSAVASIQSQELIDSYETEWSTYVGVYFLSSLQLIDEDANTYLIFKHSTNSDYDFSDFITDDAFQSSLTAGAENYLVILKFSPQGELLFGSYLDGGQNQIIGGFSTGVLDDDGNLYLAGRTTSETNFATPGAHQDDYIYTPLAQDSEGALPSNAFINKINLNTGTLEWQTYYGGNRSDNISSIVLLDDYLYVAGATQSRTNIATSGAYQDTAAEPLNTGEELGLGFDYFDYYQYGFMAKFTKSGQRLWGTYYGADELQGSLGLAKTKNSDYIYTISREVIDQDYFGTPQTYMPINLYPGSDVYDLSSYMGAVTKFVLDGQQRIWGTYYGGEGVDRTNSIILDSEENIYGFGNTTSEIKGYIGTDDAYIEDHPNPGEYAAFIYKLNSDGEREWGTYLNIANDFNQTFGEYGRNYRMHITDNDELFVYGYVTSDNNVATASAMQSNISGNSDAVIYRFDGDGNKDWGTLWGGNQDEIITNMKSHGDTLYVSGITSSDQGISTAGAVQEDFLDLSSQWNPNSSVNYFLAKLRPVQVLQTSETQAQELVLYPNANNGNFSIVSKQTTRPERIRIYDMNGRLLFDRRMDFARQQDFRLSRLLATGLYMVELQNVDLFHNTFLKIKMLALKNRASK